MNKTMNAALCIVAVMVTACVGATVQPKAAPAESAMGEPTGLDSLNNWGNAEHAGTCSKLNGIYFGAFDLCCPKNFSFGPPVGAVYPANQVCSKHPQF
jgi:hypothetical protein